MRWTSILAIYSLFWTLSAFVILPFGVRTHEEAGVDRVPGQADSAPVHFRPKAIVLRTSILALLLFGVFYVNYIEGWISIEAIDLFGGGPPGYHDPDYLKPRASSR